MPTPPKPVSMLRDEKKSHRTKKELALREAGEKSLVSGVAIKVQPKVRSNAIAYKEFKRIVDLLKRMEKDDAVYQGVINRYCLIFAEIHELENRKETITIALTTLEESFETTVEQIRETNEINGEALLKYISKFARELNNLNAAYASLDKQIQTKRKMLFEIEKENVMTIAAALRSIPKKVETTTNPLLEALSGS